MIHIILCIYIMYVCVCVYIYIYIYIYIKMIYMKAWKSFRKRNLEFLLDSSTHNFSPSNSVSVGTGWRVGKKISGLYLMWV